MPSQPTVALVTGAYRGIGREIVRQLGGRGVRVFLAARRRDAGESAAAEIGGGVEFLELNVTDDASIARAVERVRERAGRLDVLVNNAAILLDGQAGVVDLGAETVRQTLETNVLGVLRVTLAFLPLLRASAAPRVINVSSGAGQLADGLQSWAPAYSMSKTALNSLTQQLASALPEFAINSVCPGWVRTEMGGENAPRSVEQGADTMTWLATEAPQNLTGKFLRDRAELPW